MAASKYSVDNIEKCNDTYVIPTMQKDDVIIATSNILHKINYKKSYHKSDPHRLHIPIINLP